MNILIIGNGPFGKIDEKVLINQHTGNLLLDLKNNNIRPLMLQSSQYRNINKNENLLDFDLISNKIDFIEIIRGSKSIIEYIKNIFKIFKVILKFKYIYIFSPGTLGLLIGLISSVSGKKIGLYVRGEYIQRKSLYNFLAKRANFILTVSPLIKKRINNKNILVIKPMINIDMSSRLYKPYNPSKKIQLLFVGRLEYRKGIFDLINMCSILDSKKILYNMDVVGGGDLYDKLIEDQKNKKISKNVRFHGLISEKTKLDSFYKKADIFYFPSHDEGFPRVLYEAMSYSLPIFTTFVGGIPGYMINNENCIKIPEKNSESASKILISYLDKKDIMCKLSENAFNIVFNIFNGDLLEHHILIKEKFNDKQNV